jgi:hypothetical protein
MAQGKQGNKDQAPQGTKQGAKPQAGSEMQGEGNYDAARRYNQQTTEHAQGGNVEQAARDAEPSSRSEQKELEGAEERGRKRAKDEDPLLEHPDRISKDDSTDAPK